MDRRKHFTASFAFCIVILALPCAAAAKIIYVDDDANAPGNGSSWQTAYKYLQDALTDAKTAEKPVEIRVAQGVYKPGRSAAHPQGIEHTEYFRLTDGMSLLGGYTGLAGADPHARDIQLCQTVLSGDLAGNDAPVTDAGTLMKDPTRNDNSNIMGISADKGRVRLEGCTVTGGSYGALLAWGPSDDNEEASVTIMDCTFSGNRGSWADAPAAGAVNMVGQGLRLVRCLFEGNAAPMGGAVKASQHVVLDSCQFIGNYASDGGAVNLGYGTIVNCTFVGNTAVNGGAIHLGPDYSHSSEIIGCVFRQNRASSAGALSFDGEMDIRDSLFAGNEAINTAGACYQTRGPAKLTNCMLVGNRAGRSAAAWYAGWRARLEATNCTMADNRSSEGLFLVVNHYGETLPNPITVSNCILADGGGEIQSRDVPVEITYTRVPDKFKALGSQENRLPWGLGNIAVDPCFADPGYWDPNGTPEDPNDDLFVEGDYHLKSQAGRWDAATQTWVVDDVTSPCIDAGDPNSPVGDEPEPNGGRVNMGAYGGTAEASKSYLAAAKVIYVDDDAPAPGDGSSWQTAYKYLQDALGDAKAAEKPAEIRVAQGTYKPDGGVGFVRGNQRATFRLISSVALRGGYAGLAGPDPDVRDVRQYESVLSGDLQDNDPEVDDLADLLNANVGNSYTVVTGSGTDSTAVLDGFTVTGGRFFIISDPLPEPGAAGMYNMTGSPTIMNCTFARNAAIGSAAMYNRQGSDPTLIDCVFTQNYAIRGGAAIANRKSSPRLIGCIFRDNESSYSAAMFNGESSPVVDTCTFVRNSGFEGGAIYNLQSSPTLIGCLFQENTAGAGGAVLNDEGSTLTLTACVFTGNSAKYGGAVYDAHSSVRSTISNCIFRMNLAGQFGGAINGGNSTVTNCIFAGNRALRLLPDPKQPSTGGAIITSNITLTNCTFDGNWAQVGRAMYCYPPSAQARNCIFWGSEDLINDNHAELPMDVRYSNIQHGWPGEGNIDVDPCFVRHGRWADRDDTNRAAEPNDPNAIWVDGDYHLKSQAGRWDPASKSWVKDDVTSPCIDAGDPNSPIGEEPFPNGGRVNMGAYGGTAEASKSYSDGPVAGAIIRGDINGDRGVALAD